MAVRQYIGARYVPTYYENSQDPTSSEWEPNVRYDPLTIVSLPNMHSYQSKKMVPATVGSPAQNPEYWYDQGYAQAYYQALQDQINDMKDGDVEGSLQNQINDNSTDITTLTNHMSLGWLSDDHIVYPTDNPLGTSREVMKFVAKDAGSFVDNVLAIQNNSHGEVGSNPNVYGNAAIAFFDNETIERGAIGFSRDSVNQPYGFVADCMYIEGGNAFGADHDTDIKLIMTNSTGFAAGHFMPLEAISSSGALKLRSRGTANPIEMYNGVKLDNKNDAAVDMVLAPMFSDHRFGLATNVTSGDSLQALDPTKLSMSISIGDANNTSAFSTSWGDGVLIAKQSHASDTGYLNGVTPIVEINSNGRTYVGSEHGYKSWGFNGTLNVSTNTNLHPAICIKNDASNAVGLTNWVTGASSVFQEFLVGASLDASSTKGSISYNSGTNTIAYNTTSDYRIKHIKGEKSGALDLIKKIKVYTGTIGSGIIDCDYVLAHELQEIVPYAVSGYKDQVDANGKAVLQMVDYSKLIPILIAAIQEVANV